MAEALSDMGLVKPLRMMGLPDRFIDHGEVPALLAACGLDAKGIRAQVQTWFAPYLESTEVPLDNEALLRV